MPHNPMRDLTKKQSLQQQPNDSSSTNNSNSKDRKRSVEIYFRQFTTNAFGKIDFSNIKFGVNDKSSKGFRKPAKVNYSSIIW